MTLPNEPRHILCIDDNADTCVLIGLILRSEDIQMTTTCEVAHALEVLQNEPVDLLITDLWLTQGSGDELCRTARRLHPTTKIVVTSDFDITDPNFQEKSLADACLAKPFDFNNLVQTVRSLLAPNGFTSPQT